MIDSVVAAATPAAAAASESAPAVAKAVVIETSGFLPFLHLGKDLDLPTYFLVISASLIICVLWLVRRCDQRSMNRVTALDFALITMLGGFIGARLFHVFFEEPAYYFRAPSRVLQVWMGGFVWYGGAIFSFVGCAIYARVRKLHLISWADLFAPVCALGYCLGRVACWLTGCCYGKVCVLDEGISFRHPTQIYAVLWEALALAALLAIEKRPGKGRGVFFIWLILHGLGRMMMEVFRDDPRGPEPLGISISTWLSFAIIASAAIALSKLRSQARSPVKV